MLGVNEGLFELFFDSSGFSKTEGGDNGVVKLFHCPATFELDSLDMFSAFFEFDNGYSFGFLYLVFVEYFLFRAFVFLFLSWFDKNGYFWKLFNPKGLQIIRNFKSVIYVHFINSFCHSILDELKATSRELKIEFWCHLNMEFFSCDIS